MNENIDENVSIFFIMNEYFCFLVDKDTETHYEIPVVGYVKKPENRLNYCFLFGQSKSNKNNILGPFYYFSISLDNLCNMNVENTHLLIEDNSNIKCGIIRFALFTGFTKYINNENNSNIVDDDCDEENIYIDNSYIKKERLMDDTLDKNMEQLTMKITDYDGRWSEIYDSVYMNNIELDNGKILILDFALE
jgi:hypothetical protein